MKQIKIKKIMNSNPIVVYVVTLGCAKNLVDAEVMCGDLAVNGIYLTTIRDDADIILINTCSFIRDARQEAEDEIRKALDWKEKGAKEGVWRAVAVSGCLPQRNPKECAVQYPNVDLFLGLDDVPKVHEFIYDLVENKIKNRNIPSGRLSTYLYNEETPRITVTPQNYAYIKIAEGCDHRCAFCAIPAIRGHFRSRTIPSILTEFQNLLEQGVGEINLIAQDTTHYGHDLNDGTNLAKLLRACDKLEGDFWIRVLYTHPFYMTDEVLDLLAHSKHVAPYLDIPLQHISDSILNNMQRRIGREKTLALMENIKKNYPELTVRTTMLLGFPGETETDFQQLLQFVKEYKFDHLGAFAFSLEEGTPAMNLKLPPVPEEVAQQRRGAILEVQQDVALEKNAALVGQECRVLLEEPEDDSHYTARMLSDAAEVDNIVHVAMLPGDHSEEVFASVKITGAGQYDYEAVQLDH